MQFYGFGERAGFLKEHWKKVCFCLAVQFKYQQSFSWIDDLPFNTSSCSCLRSTITVPLWILLQKVVHDCLIWRVWKMEQVQMFRAYLPDWSCTINMHSTDLLAAVCWLHIHIQYYQIQIPNDHIHIKCYHITSSWVFTWDEMSLCEK